MMEDMSASRAKSVVQWGVRMPMRDGVELEADITFPSADGVQPLQGRYATLLMRTPYNRALVRAIPHGMVASSSKIAPDVAAANGYVMIHQDVRGTGGSQGVLEPMLNEAQDGIDTLAWIRSQPWSDGRVCTLGSSYMGGVQMLLAAEAPDGLTAVCSHVAGTDQFKHDWVYFEGVLSLELAISWALMVGGDLIGHFSDEVQDAINSDIEALTGSRPDPNGPPFSRTPAFVAILVRLIPSTPLRDLPVVRHIPWWHQWIDNRENPDHFKANEMQDKFATFGAPALHVGGWYDGFLRNTISHYKGITSEARDPRVRDGQRLLIGPWSHVDCPNCPPGATVDSEALDLAWIDYWVHGKEHPFFEYRVVLYVQGENRWRAEQAWPLHGTRLTRFYFHSEGNANTADGDGTLSTERPGEEAADTYRYNPANPVPTKGGISMNGGRAAQNDAEAREDVLCYTTGILKEDVEVTGEVTATLHAATSATDTDWWVRLVDVSPDGTASTLNHGVVRARYRNSRTSPEPVHPGAVLEYKVAMQATSNVFKKGHRIRVEVSSSCFPMGERNPNAFIDLAKATEADFIVAEQTLYHSGYHASYIELPIIPATRERKWIDTPFPIGSGEHFTISTPLQS